MTYFLSFVFFHRFLVFIFHQNNDRALHLASQMGHNSIISALINAGCDKNAKGYYNRTALMCASQKGHLTSVETLLTGGCDMEAADKVKLTN